jgi:hypothetical protein
MRRKTFGESAAATSTGMSKPGTTFVQRYERLPPPTEYSRIGIFVVVRYCSNTFEKSTPA